MKICFQAIFAKTVFFHALAKRLECNGHEIYWTSTSRKWTDWLVTQGVARSHILLLERDQLTQDRDGDSEPLDVVNRIETEYGLPLKTIYYMDRIIGSWSWDEARAYMIGVIREVDRFVRTNDIQVMFGEATSSDEILSAAICRLRGRAFYHPGTARIPSDRFLFFKDHLQQEYQSSDSNQVSEEILARADDIRDGVISGTKPNYWYWNNKIPAFNTGFVQKIAAKVREALVEARKDATVKSIGYHLTRQRQYLKPFRYVGLKLRPVFQQPAVGEKFVLYTLHKQPEASIDVFGADYADQPHLIRQIARHLPADTWLYVKEHSNCIGDRTRKELRQLARLPGVRLIDPHYDVHKLIRDAQAILTVSGTVAFEAALYGKPTGTFSRMYFSGLSSIKHLRQYHDIEVLLRDDKETAGWTENDRRTLAHIIANSHEGVIGDPLSTPVCLLEENIERVAAAIEQLCTNLNGTFDTPQVNKPSVTIICDSHGAGYGATGFAEIMSGEMIQEYNVRSYALGGLSVKDILDELMELDMPETDTAVIQVGNPDVHPRMPIRPLRALRSLGMSFCRDSLFSIPPRPSLRYFLRFPFFLVRLAIIRFHQEFLVSTDELQEDLDRLIAYVRARSQQVILMPVYHVHPAIYTTSHNDRADIVNRYLAKKYPGMYVRPRILRPGTYQRYYNKDGFHYIRRYHERVASWLMNKIGHRSEGKRELVIKRVPAGAGREAYSNREQAVV